MYSWSTDELALQSKDPKQYQIWKQVQLINYGLNEEKLDLELLVSNWDVIKNQLDPLKASVIEYWLWGNRLSLPNYKHGSWSWS